MSAVGLAVKEITEKLIKESVQAAAGEAVDQAVKQGIRQGIRNAVGDLVQKFGREGVTVLAKDLTEKTAIELIKTLNQESAELLVKNMFRSAAGDFLEHLTKESASEFVEKLGKEGLESFIEKVGREGTQELISKISKESAGELVEKISKESLQGLIESGTKTQIRNFTKNLSQQSLDNMVTKLGKEGTQELGQKLGLEGTTELIEGLSRSKARELTRNLGKDFFRSASKELTSLNRTRLISRVGVALGLAGGVGVYAYLQGDDATNGAWTDAAIDAAVESIKDGYEGIKEMDREDVSRIIHNTQNVAKILIPDGSTGPQTLWVKAQMAMQSGTEEEKLEAGRNAAIGYQIMKSPLVGAATTIRAQLYKDIYPELTPSQRNKLLAEGLIDDILTGANRTSAVIESEFTREEIGQQINENPNYFMNIPTENLRDGILQVYPYLRDNPVIKSYLEAQQYAKDNPEGREAPDVRGAFQRIQGESFDVNLLSESSMASVFNQAAENSGFLGTIWKLVAGIAGIFGGGARRLVQSFAMSTFDKDVRLDALKDAANSNQLVAANGDKFEIEGSDVTQAPPAPEVPEADRSRYPGLTPGGTSA